jgi:hypothetical protein
MIWSKEAEEEEEEEDCNMDFDNLPHGDPKIGATTFVSPSPPSLNEGWTFGSKKYVLQSLVIVTLESLNCLLVLISRTNRQSDRKGLHTTSTDVSVSGLCR